RPPREPARRQQIRRRVITRSSLHKLLSPFQALRSLRCHFHGDRGASTPAEGRRGPMGVTVTRTRTRADKTELAVNVWQVMACRRHAGAARFAYTWGLAHKHEVYRAIGKSPSAIDLHRELNTRKHTDLSWLYQVSTCAPQEALRHLDQA